MPVPSSADLVPALSRLLTETQQREVVGLQASFPDAQALARELVRRGWLTVYQVNRLFQGKADALVLGPYVLLERLGEGGMGAVFKARHQVMNRVVAVKLIRKEHLTGPDAVTRFRREIEVVGRLSHPNVVTAHDAGQVEERHFLVMEYVEGSDLARLVERGGPLPVGLACEYVRQAALGLHCAHEQGLVHRDIKPSNLMVDVRGVVKLLDLGLARPGPGGAPEPGHMAVTRAGEVMGTPDYLAPEQALDARAADKRADIYSLGCTLYFLLTGRPPFPEGTLAQKLLWHQHTEPLGAETLRPDVPPEVAAVVRRMMAKRPEDRHQTAAEVAAALASFCQAGAPATSAGSVPVAVVGERGWTLAVDTVPGQTPETPPSLIDRPAQAPERGWTLPVSPTVSSVTGSPSPHASRKRLWLGLAGGGALALVVALALWLGSRPERDGGPKIAAPAPPEPVAEHPKALPPIPEGPLTVEIVDKKGAKKRVVVVSASGSGRDYLAGRILAKSARLAEGPLLELQQGLGVSLFIPFNLVRKMAVRDGGHSVTLADGTEHAGDVRTTVEGEQRDSWGYELKAVNEATVVRARSLTRRKASGPTWTLTVLDPVNRTFRVFAPRFVDLKGESNQSLSITVAKVSVQHELPSLEKLTVNRLDGWLATAQAVSQEPRTGALQGIGTSIHSLACDLPDGSLLLLELSAYGSSPGFVLQKVGKQ
ncbi:MAG: serine/threonine protein kinase [Gemmataceae bacterium]|nr:serine/threonine protein kinase [Gemmataceae bacterium]